MRMNMRQVVGPHIHDETYSEDQRSTIQCQPVERFSLGASFQGPKYRSWPQSQSTTDNTLRISQAYVRQIECLLLGRSRPMVRSSPIWRPARADQMRRDAQPLQLSTLAPKHDVRL